MARLQNDEIGLRLSRSPASAETCQQKESSDRSASRRVHQPVFAAAAANHW
jgi:hypothetical protein